MNKRTNNPDYYEESEDGFHQLQMGADGPSAIFFKQVGQKVIVKFQDVTNAKDQLMRLKRQLNTLFRT